MKLGDRIRELRKSKGETLQTTSKGTKLSISYLSDIERGRTNPSLQTLEALAAHFTINLTDLLYGVDFAGELTEKALPPGLSELIKDEEWANEIDKEWVELLMKISLRGARPQSKKQWLELYLSLRRILDTA
jgi:transcriptional regulator with XRE-family HTH domain